MGKPGRKSKAYRSGDVTLGWRDSWAVAEFRDPLTGRRQRVRLGQLDDAAARIAIDRFAQAMAAVQNQRAGITVSKVWAKWLEDRAKDGFSNDIYSANWVSLNVFFGHLAVDHITVDHCRDYARGRFALGRKAWTVWTEMSRLRYCLKWAEKRSIITKAPYIWIPSKGQPRQRVLSFDEARALIDGAGDPHILLFILLALTTGARHLAILDLTWDRVDWISGTIQYDDDLEPDPMSKSWRKGRATVPIGPMVRSELERAFAGRQCEHVIEHGGQRLKTVRSGFANAVVRAKLDESQGKVTPHVIRHSVATWMRDRGEDFYRIAQMLGHADSKTSELIYAHPDASTHLRGAVNIIDAELAALPTMTPSEAKSPP